jgi:hypothetical protein
MNNVQLVNFTAPQPTVQPASLIIGEILIISFIIALCFWFLFSSHNKE